LLDHNEAFILSYLLAILSWSQVQSHPTYFFPFFRTVPHCRQRTISELRRRWNQTGASQAASSWHLPSSFICPLDYSFPPVARSLPPNQCRTSGGGHLSIYNQHTPAAVVRSVTELKPKVRPITCYKSSEKEYRYISTLPLTSTRDGDSGQLNAPAVVTPENRTGTNFTGGWMGPSFGLEGCRKFRPHRDSIPRQSSLYRVGIPTTLYGPIF